MLTSPIPTVPHPAGVSNPPCDLPIADPAYARRFAGPVGAYLLSVQAHATRRMLAPFHAARVLDLGGAHGQNAELLCDLGHDVTVYGSAPGSQRPVLDLVRDGRVRFDRGPLDRLPYGDNDLDVVVSYRITAHVDDPAAFVAEMCRVARGAVVLDYPSWRSVNLVGPALFALKRHVESGTRPYRSFWPGQVDRWFADHGFVRADTFGQFVWPMALHRLLQRPGLSRSAEAVPRALGLHRFFGSPVIACYRPRP
ncbi:MAG: methyltransferase domain-containing protein [Planctomycetota bacterium]